VSRQHARLECQTAECILVDLGSANGTFVDGQRIERAVLQFGSVLTLGNSTLAFEVDAPAETAAALSSPAAGTRQPRQGSGAKGMLDQLLLAFENDAPEAEISSAAIALREQLLDIAYIVVHTPQQGWWEVPFTNRESWSIGRDPASDIYIDHQKVSRQHARIERHNDTFVVRDLHSANGTWLGERRIEIHTLQHADTLTIGNARLVFKNPSQTRAERSAARAEMARAPVIVIPGSFGSSLWRGSEQVWPSVRTLLAAPHKLFLPEAEPLEARSIVGEVEIVPGLFKVESYNRIGDFLEGTLRYTRQVDLLELAFDWRQDLRLAARRLAELVENWDVGQPITIIAHSLGCLVSRYYVDCLGGHQKVGRQILIGGPNQGIAAGLVNALPAHLRDQLPAMLALGGALGKKMLDMLSTFPASFQLLPTYPCIYDQNGEPIDLHADNSWLPEAKRPLLRAAREFHQQLAPRARIPTICIVGYGSSTVTKIEIERDRNGTWQSLKYTSTADGDNMVETRSAILEGAELHPVHRDHNSLYVDEDVLMRLKLELAG
jgi:pSer/pThr/pTyr-binding forkhead associated (FHA) protein